MGQEVVCIARWAGKSVRGRALLETSEILFRGDARLKIPFSAIRGLTAENGELRLKTDGGVVAFELGERAEKWREKIANPKSVVEKLGIKAGDAVALIGKPGTEFLDRLKERRAAVEKKRMPAGVPWVFLFADVTKDLGKVKSLAGKMKGSTALWVVYPKGLKSITETEVIGAGRKAGLKDVKVVGFSTTHTALKFVIPVEKR